MKRSGFKPSGPPRRPAKQVNHTPPPTRAVMMTGPALTCAPLPKQDLQEFRDYRRLVATLKCICCGVVGFSQAAHPNTGKGMGLKTDDRDCFPLCTVGGNDCHGGFDQRAMFSKEKRREIEPLWANHTRMMLRTLAESDPDVRGIVERSIGL